MAAADKIASIFFSALAVFVCVESYSLGLGSFSNPGAGLFPFLSAALLAALASVDLFHKISFRKAILETREMLASWQLKRPLSVLALLFSFGYLLEHLGFLISAFFFVFLVHRLLEPSRWKTGLAVAALSTSGCYLIFEIIIQAQFPKGILPF